MVQFDGKPADEHICHAAVLIYNIFSKNSGLSLSFDLAAVIDTDQAPKLTPVPDEMCAPLLTYIRSQLANYRGIYKRKWNEFWNSWVEDNIQQSDLAGYPPQTWRHFIDALYKNLIEEHKSMLSPEKIVL
jgi:hypothetical protein